MDNDGEGDVCDLSSSSLQDLIEPASGETAFYLVTGVLFIIESDLGFDSDGVERTNAYPCP